MNEKVEFLYLQQEDCVLAGGMDMKGTLAAVERSFYLHGKNDYIQPGKPVIRWGDETTEETTGRIMSMPSFLGGNDYAEELKKKTGLGPINTSGIKFIPSKPSNPAKYNLPRANAVIIIVDNETLMPACIMDGTLVSAMRTGAASGVAAKYLANKDSLVMGLVGASIQGITQTLGIKEGTSSIKECKVFDINPKMSENFVKKMEKFNTGLEFKIVNSAKEAVENSDIVSTATIANEAYVKPQWYKKGMLHCEISFWDTPPYALSNIDFIVVDDWYQVKHHGVDVSYRAVKEGIIDESKIRGNLGEIIVGTKAGRKNSKEKIFFNPIGLGIHDLSEAHRVFMNAKQKGIGRKLSLWDNFIF
jgi:N-[(2S)-2-amino-2-carboxyethyl]-L-glutamate dehydrogenase